MMMTVLPRNSVLFLGGIGVLSLLCTGCGGPGNATKANFAQIKDGMAVADVEAVLGKGTAITTKEIENLPLPEGSKIPFFVMSPGSNLLDSKGRKEVKWLKWGNNKTFILLGFVDDKVMTRLSNGL